MPLYRCTKRTTLPSGQLARIGEVHNLDAKNAHSGSWEEVNNSLRQTASATSLNEGGLKAGKNIDK